MTDYVLAGTEVTGPEGTSNGVLRHEFVPPVHAMGKANRSSTALCNAPGSR
jgi:hypothetical protein